MMFDHIQMIGQFTNLSVKQTDARTPIGKIQMRAVVVSATHALVYDFIGIARHIQHIAKGGELIGVHLFNHDCPRHGKISINRNSAIRSTCLQAWANSVSVSLPIRYSKAAIIDALSWSRTAMMNGNPCLATYSVFNRVNVSRS